jgi:hypothetical protein
VGILVETKKGEFKVAELTSQGVLIQDFHDRILYSRSEEIAVRKLALADESLRKQIPEIIKGLSHCRHKVSVTSAFPWGKKRQSYQLKLLAARKTLEDVEEDIRQTKNVSEFQKRSLEAERLKVGFVYSSVCILVNVWFSLLSFYNGLRSTRRWQE